MYPQAFDGGPPTYGLAIAGGFLLATIVGARSSRRRGIDVGFWLDLCFWLIPISLIGARLLHVLVNAREFIDSCRAPSAGELAHSPLWRCSRALHIWEGGFAYLGGVIAATAFSWWFCRRRKLPFLRVADLGAPALAVGHVLGRLGCYFAGCCFGRPNPRWGARFPRGSVAFDEWLRRGELSPLATRTPDFIRRSFTRRLASCCCSSRCRRTAHTSAPTARSSRSTWSDTERCALPLNVCAMTRVAASSGASAAQRTHAGFRHHRDWVLPQSVWASRCGSSSNASGAPDVLHR